LRSSAQQSASDHFGTFNSSSTTGGTFIATGLAIGGVSAVSFTVGGEFVEVPVNDNVWVYCSQTRT
jgi:hypothetical protein